MKVPARYKALTPYLVGEVRPNGECDMRCPLHMDRKRSASLNVKEGVWICFAGCGSGRVEDLLAQQEDWIPMGQQAPTPKEEVEPEPLPTMDEVRAWSKNLLDSEVHLDRFINTRGLHSDTIRKYLIGFHPKEQVYTIPVFNFSGELINVRFYVLGGNTRSKIWSIKGHGSSVLYPFSSLEEDPDQILICEGELDTLIAIQSGYPAITRTGSAGNWYSAWNKHFADRKVYICQDCDKPGEAGTVKIGHALRKVAGEVRVIKLPYPVTDDHGKDLSDFWKDRGGTDNRKAREEFSRLFAEAQLYDAKTLRPKEIDPSDADVIDALNAELFGQPLRLTVTVKGKAKGGYSLPHKVHFACDRSAGKICAHCPMQDTGEGETEIQRKNPAILKMIGSKDEDVARIIKGIVGIPGKCNRVEIDHTRQSVEILYARPSVEHVNGTRADFTSLRLTSVGRHNTPSNCTVQVVGALHNNPRNQENEFLAWDVAQMRTLEEDFEVNADMIKQLSRFRPKQGQTPLEKLREIADDLAKNVTHIYGRPQLHAAVDLVFHSALQFRFQGSLLQRGWLELLIIGDTRTGKSEIATRLIEHYQAGEIVNCEAASFAGVVGGTQQIRNEWMLTWGAIPINDRRLVVLDEISGLSVEEIGQMSSMRSSGVAAIEKVVQERTPARVRLIWMGNPRDDIPMGAYTYGVYALKPLIGRAEDIARFDLALTLKSDDVDLGKLLGVDVGVAPRYTRDACSNLIRWAWTRTPDQIEWLPGSEALVLEKALELGEQYVSEPPLILKADLRIKLARLSVAIAARLFSTSDGDTVEVGEQHVSAAAEFIDLLYSQPGFGYRQLSNIRKEDSAFALKQKDEVTEYIDSHPEMWRFLRMLPEGRFYARDLEEVLNVSREQANGIVNHLISTRMAQKDKGGIRVTVELQDLLKENA